MIHHGRGDRGLLPPDRQRETGLAERLAALGMELLDEVGRGARTVVYRARRGNALYAVKVLATAGQGPEAVEFRREAALLACVQHPGLVPVHEVGEVAGRPYLVMDLVPGRSLAQVLRGERLSESRVLELAIDAAGALGQAHRAGLVHRDVKPDNLMIGDDGRVRLIDFGLAGRSGVRAENVAVGTFTYSAPEQTGVLHRPVDARADLYALGVVLYECLAGEPPFVAADAGELIWLHLSATPAELNTVRPDVSPPLAAMVATLLAKDPDDRYQSADALRVSLERIRDGGDPALPPRPVDVPDDAFLFPLVGREAELAGLRARWARARAGAGGAALVHGDTGCGKSRLVQELTADVAASGHPVLYGKCDPDQVTPLAVLRGVLEQYVEAVTRRAEPARAVAMAQLRTAAGETASVLGALFPKLTDLLAAPRLPDGDHERQVVEAVAALLVGLADEAGGAVLHLDDVQWCDDGSRVVLRRLAVLLPESRLLVVATGGDDGAAAAAVESFGTDLGPAVDVRLGLGPLTEGAIATLVAGQLGPSAAPPALVARLASRSGGNPMAVLEYTRAVIDAGLLRPSWGTWLLDEPGLADLALPDDVLDLVLRRIDTVGAAAREVLTVAATVGGRFTADLVAAVTAGEPQAVHAALTEVAGHRLIEATSGGRYLFPHDGIREALLADVDPDRLRRLHRRVAEELERLGDADPDRVYQVARHYLLGGTGDRPDRVFRAAAAAGAAALAQQAPADALDFLTQANAAAEVAGLRPGPGFHADLGLAAHRLGRYDLAREQLQLALDGEADPERRAHVCRLLADAHLLRYEGDQAIERVRQGLAELGHPLPRNPLLLSVSTLALSGWGAVLARLPARWRAVPPATAQRYRLRVALTGTGGEAATMAQRLPLVAALLLRTMPLAQHLRPGPEYILNQGGVAFLAGAMGRRRRCERILGRATEAARRTGDLGLTARLHYFRGVVLDMLPPMSSTSGADLTDIIAEQGRWMDVGLHLTMAATLEQMLLVRGHARLAAESHHQVLTRVQGDDEVLRHMFTAVGAQIAALSGQPAEAARQLRVAREALASMPGNTVLRTKVAIAAVHLAVEQGEVGDVLDAALAEFHALGTTPAKAWNIDRAFWVHQAFGRLAQVGAANPADRARLLATAADAVRQLRRAANGPVLRAYADVAHCALRQLRGDNAGALRRLARVDQHRHGLDLPLLYFDMARIRARAYQGLGRHADARWQARIAALVAAEQGWVTRVRWVQAEFGVVDGGRATASPATGSHRRTATSTVNVDVTAAATGINQRRLQSLQQVGLAAATTLDPAQVARLVLDEIVSVFAAERAFLFLREPGGDGDELRPYLGRDDARADLTVLTGYGSTLVDRVRDTGEPLVVTGSEEGAALGSQSSLIHGLRSIMVAPLQLKGRLIGVIYLDSRTAKGIFTTADLDILAAITHHVATSLETARAAQLELGIQAARRERDLAQLLHRAMTDLGASLDPQQVAQRLVDTVAAALPVAAAVLLRCADDGSTTVSAALGNGTAAVGAAVPAVGLGADGGRLGVDAAADLPPGLLGTETGAWLAVPLTVRGEQRGLLIAGAPPARPYTEAEVDIAAALAGQGAVALENALLFRQVEELATRDSLTGLFNRRHFFDFARHRVAASHRYERPMAVVMIDIDHFKRVNDTHGHLAGDDVIREVAHRLASTLRDSDVICRYGGEEFAVLLPETAQEDACVAAARLHQVVGATPVATRVGPLPVTVSVGLAAPAGGDDVNSLIQHADEALYKAKRAGRNQIATHP